MSIDAREVRVRSYGQWEGIGEHLVAGNDISVQQHLGDGRGI